tara:strand:- start:272 stop:1111 length:840 start_codon:yes stop_codon:yes gene_type:complete
MRVISMVLCVLSFNAFASNDEKIKDVFAKKASLKVIKDSVIYPAEVKSRVYSEVKAQIDGIVDNLYITLGTRVKVGQKVLSLKNQDSTLNYRKNSTSTPVEGVLSKVMVRKGSYVSKGQTLFIITEPEKSYVSVEVPVKDLSQISIGHKAKLKISLIDKNLDVVLVGKGNIVNKTTGTVTCEFNIEKQKELVPGLLGRVELDFSNVERMMIEESSLLYVGDKKLIRKIESNIVKKYEVKIGLKRNGKVEVLEGLKVGEDYVSRSNGYLVDGDKVKVIKK